MATPDIFKQYEIYEWEGVHWLCACNSNSEERDDNDQTIGCDELFCDNYGHLRCYGINKTASELNCEYHHKCFQCQRKRVGRPLRWTDKDDCTLKEMKSNGQGDEIIGRVLHRPSKHIQERWGLLKQKKNTISSKKNKKYYCAKCDRHFETHNGLGGHIGKVHP
eukprot:UN09031